MLIKVYLEDNTIVEVDSELNSIHIPCFRKVGDKFVHRIDGPAMYDDVYSLRNRLVLKGNALHPYSWSLKTSHITCELCEDFCKQSCF